MRGDPAGLFNKYLKSAHGRRENVPFAGSGRAQDQLTPAQQEAAIKVYQAYSGAQSMIQLIEAKDPTGMEYGKNVVQQIRPAIEEAEKLGVPADYPITCPGSDEKITIAELKKNLPGWPGESTAAADQVKAEQDAKLAPHRAKLSGDKLRIFNEVFTLGLKCYGEGGKVLATPEEYAAAKIWASVGHPPDSRNPTGKSGSGTGTA